MKCHIECLNKKWELQEKINKKWIKTPYVKTFECLAEARKALINYIKNPDFQDIEFRLKERSHRMEK